ncbi:GDSL esterase/lipase At5g03610-like isoform X4 [Tasmannia lanceolata]|uniref:GDSL esterase/lipase At5g03610-like isoform X4 n=1 Tax=Tasmannia lanceolata TaxID=3420 RepID=UPI00406310FF
MSLGILYVLFFVYFIGVEVQGSHHHHHHHHKLFVFGDSYADTGNTAKLISRSWKEPYGFTFPGKPSGRWSDGRVLTDYLASFLGIRTPIAYKWRKMGPKPLRYGMNFAFGGAGVFNTLNPVPNLTAQIDFFQEQIKEGVYTKSDIESSLALISIVGNDYTAYQARNGTLEGLQAFSTSLIIQLAMDLKGLNDLGVKKIAMTSLQPFGCLPADNTLVSLNQCDETQNQASSVHNLILDAAVQELNKTNEGLKITVLDLYNAFLSILQSPANQGRWKFENPLKACCEGINSNYSCGSTDENGNKMYTLCEKPHSSFFWDSLHPSQHAWAALAAYLSPTFHTLNLREENQFLLF